MIEKKVFYSNLKLTQHYCEYNKLGITKDCASNLRTINPIINDQKAFQFKEIDNDQFGKLKITDWIIDPLYEKDIIDDIFEIQLSHKKEISYNHNDIIEGKILVSYYKETLFEGFCQLTSNGFIDEYDLPPIDTWFYINKSSELLYSWIPKKFYSNIDEAIHSSSTDIYCWVNYEI